MSKLNLTEEWYQNALELEADHEVSAGPPNFSFYEQAMEAEAEPIGQDRSQLNQLEQKLEKKRRPGRGPD